MSNPCWYTKRTNILPADISMFCLSSSNFRIFSSNSCFILSIRASFSLCKFEIEINFIQQLSYLCTCTCMWNVDTRPPKPCKHYFVPNCSGILWVKQWKTEIMQHAHSFNHGRMSGDYTGFYTVGVHVSITLVFKFQVSFRSKTALTS